MAGFHISPLRGCHSLWINHFVFRNSLFAFGRILRPPSRLLTKQISTIKILSLSVSGQLRCSDSLTAYRFFFSLRHSKLKTFHPAQHPDAPAPSRPDGEAVSRTNLFGNPSTQLPKGGVMLRSYFIPPAGNTRSVFIAAVLLSTFVPVLVGTSERSRSALARLGQAVTFQP